MCNCITDMNEIMRPRNTMLDTALLFLTNPPQIRMRVATLPVNPKRKQKAENLIANYCPICGEKYPEFIKL
jgi:hypothetical protein